MSRTLTTKHFSAISKRVVSIHEAHKTNAGNSRNHS